MRVKRSRRHHFPTVYRGQDAALLVNGDKAHETLRGPATQKISQRELYNFGKMSASGLSVASGARYPRKCIAIPPVPAHSSGRYCAEIAKGCSRTLRFKPSTSIDFTHASHAPNPILGLAVCGRLGRVSRRTSYNARSGNAAAEPGIRCPLLIGLG